MLTILLLIPFLGSLLLLLWPKESSPGRLRAVALVVLIAQLLWSLALLLRYDPALPGLQLVDPCPGCRVWVWTIAWASMACPCPWC